MENEEKTRTEKLKNLGGMLLIALAVFAVDQLSKLWIRTHLALREVITPIPAIGSWFRIIHWKNTGVAFGLFQGSGWILTVIGIVVVVGIMIYSIRNTESPLYLRVALAMELGGALGNLADRLNPELGYVVDFIWVGNFPVFNLADSAIVLGAIVLIIGMWKQEQQNEDGRSKKEEGIRN